MYVDQDFLGEVIERIDATSHGQTVRMRALGVCMRLLCSVDQESGYIPADNGNLLAADIHTFIGNGKPTADKYLDILQEADALKVIDGYVMVNPSWYWCEDYDNIEQKYRQG